MTTPADATQPDSGTGESEKGTGNVEKRIDQLTAKYRDAERQRDDANAQNSALVRQMATMNDQLTALTKPAPAPSRESTMDEFFNSPLDQTKTKKVAPAQADVGDIVRSAVAEALSPMIQEQKQAAVDNELRQLQTASFQEAAQYCPNVAVEGSAEQELFNKLFQGNIASDPGGPGIIIAAVQGILGSAPVKDTQKLAANTHRPMTLNDRLKTPEAARANADLTKELAEAGSERGLSPQEFQTLIGLKLGTARVKEE